ncbi:MAG: hypothetical protein JW776_16815 [Candidatus Lokiarchaeota archaeon]|nr:hypothetical protein [Candidatus Lokiarchaeota archaeon]
MADSETKSNNYREIFEEYLNYCPIYARELIDLKDMFIWYSKLKIKRGFERFEDFCILMEWYNFIGLIKPFCVAKFPKNHPFLQCINDKEVLINRVTLNSWKKMDDFGIIDFPEEIYNIDTTEESKLNNFIETDFWNHQKIEHTLEVPEEKKTEISETTEEKYIKISIEETRYYYHPIQFIQAMTLMRGDSLSLLSNRSHFEKFYWIRRFRFDDYVINRIKESLKSKNNSIEEFIQMKVDSAKNYNLLREIFYVQYCWLKPDILRLWIRVESFTRPFFYTLGSNPRVNMSWRKYDPWVRDDNKNVQDGISEYNNWYDKKLKSLSSDFSTDDLKTLRDLYKKIECLLVGNFDGLEKIVDILSIIKPSKKKKLKGFLNYLMNLIQISRYLEAFTKIWEKNGLQFPAEKEKATDFWKPNFYFDTEEEFYEHLDNLLLDYGLTPKNSVIIFVEGSTDYIFLREWLYMVYYIIGVPVIAVPLNGKSRDFLFIEYYFKVISKRSFLVLDLDKKESLPGKVANLKDKGIPEENYYLPYPDFATVNFSHEEIIRAIKKYISDNEESYEGKEEEIYDQARKRLSEMKDEEKVEDIVTDEILFGINKKEFSEYLSKVMVEQLQKRDRTKYDFEIKIGNFINNIITQKFQAYQEYLDRIDTNSAKKDP